LSCLRWANDYGEGLERKVVSSPSPQQPPSRLPSSFTPLSQPCRPTLALPLAYAVSAPSLPATSPPYTVVSSLSTYFPIVGAPQMAHSLASALPTPALSGPLSAPSGPVPATNGPSSSPMSPASLAASVALGFPGPVFALAASATSFLAPPSSMGIVVRVLLHNVKVVWGTFMAFDRAMNPVLRDCIKIDPQVGRHVHGSLVFPSVVLASLSIKTLLSPSPPSGSVGAPPLALSSHPLPWLLTLSHRLGGRLWSLLPHHSYYQVIILLPSSPPSNPSSIIVGNGSTLPVPLVCVSVLLGPFYLHNVLAAPHMIHPLLSVRRFTSDNHYSMEFDP
jgi:small nuclear ribonucleoprotein (snRNP)-like protein